MLGRKLYKTKLCILYQRGRCPRQSCSFAHGEAELRRFGGPANGRRDYRSDLRDKLGRSYSPHRRFSPGRDGRGRYGFQSHKLAPRDRGHSASRSTVARRGQRKRQQVDGESNASGSLKTSDFAEDQIQEEKVSSYGEIDAIEEQLKQTQLDIEMFNEHKCQLEMFFAEKAEEADKLSAKIEDLETQLKKEQDDHRRFSTKIKKFIKAHGHFLQAQEELKRSQSRLQSICNQLDADLKPGNIEEDSSVHVISAGEPSGDGHMSPRSETHNRTSPMKKKLRFESGTTEETKPGSLWKRERSLGTSTRLDKLSRAEVLISESENKSKEIEMAYAGAIENDAQGHLVEDNKQKDINSSPAVVPLGKARDSDSSHLLPSTSMAAHAIDDFIEAMETEEKSEAGDAAVAFENGRRDNKTGLPFLPPLPPKAMQTNYNQYQGDDEEVDVEELDADMGDADGNSEVEIQQV